jgi:16S rRNA (guanine(527)-N(7))-methyltransferase RsmG
VNRQLDRGEVAVLSALSELGLPLGLLSPLRAHATECEKTSPNLGLVSSGDEHHVLERHTADSLLFARARVPSPGERWIDVGSGAGFPGLVLATCYPRTVFVLLDSNKKKLGFLGVMILNLGLRNVELRNDRASKSEGGFDVAVSRAFAQPTLALNQMVGLVKPGGLVVVAATTEVDGIATIRANLPTIDSPGTFLMMTRLLSGSESK